MPWLKDHAGHYKVKEPFVNLLLIADVTGKSYVKDLDIVVHQSYFISDGYISLLTLYIIPEKVCHGLHVFIGPVSAFHHGQLSAGV